MTAATRQRIENILRAQLSPSFLVVHDESALHAGHAEAQRSKGGHFHLVIVADQFIGQNSVSRHRIIYALLQQEMQQAIHALSIDALTPDEAAKRGLK